MLFAVDDLQRPPLSPSANVPSVKPTVGIQNFFRLLRHFVVATKHIVALYADFADAAACKIVHVRNVDQLDFVAGGGDSYVTRHKVSNDSHLKLFEVQLTS